MGDTHAGKALLIGAVAVLGATTASAQVTFRDVWTGALTQCVGCHGADQSGGYSFSSPETFVSAGRNSFSSRAKPPRARIHPYAPEMSFLVDKLWGHVKTGEGDPMLRGGYGLVYNAPGHVAAIEEWIRAGAPPCPSNATEGTPQCPEFMEGLLQRGKPQPPFDPVPPEGTTIILEGETFTVSHLHNAPKITREGAHTSDLAAGNGAATMVTSISIQASAGTEWVALYRGEEEDPIAVSRGESLDLALPEGVGIPIEANQTFRIVQHIRNDYFLDPGAEGNPEPAGIYHNATTGNVVAYLTTDDTATTEAAPFTDSTGTDFLFVLPQRVGVTGGVWTSPGATGAVVGIWADRRAIAAGLVDPVTQQALTEDGTSEDQPELRQGYVDAGATAGVAYSCVHNNGASNIADGSVAFVESVANTSAEAAPLLRPVRAACAPAGNVPAGLPPALAEALDMSDGGACWRAHVPSAGYNPPTPALGSDCESGEQCLPANLVAGPSSEDGRCTLVGLWW